MGDVIDVIRDIQYHCTGRISCTCYRETPVKNFKEVKNKFYIRMLVDNKPGVLAAIASVFGVHKVSIARVIQKTKENDAAANSKDVLPMEGEEDATPSQTDHADRQEQEGASRIFSEDGGRN